MDSKTLNKTIVSFIESQTTLTIATCMENTPNCAICFYAYLEQHNCLIFKSGKDTQHIKEGLKNKYVAGTIVPDKLETGKIKGLQFSGIFTEPKGDLLDEAKKKYYKKYPFAHIFKGDVWLIDLNYIKYTDNTLGFGKKIKWEKDRPLPYY